MQATDHNGKHRTIGLAKGRPRRPIERTYMRTLNDAVSLADWQSIVQAAVDQAKAGNDRARTWLAQYLIGKDPPKLIDMEAEALIHQEDDRALLRAVAKRIESDDHDREFRLDEFSRAKTVLARTTEAGS